MTTSGDLLDLVVAALQAPDATDAGELVFPPGDWPTQDGQYPNLKIRVIRETKQSLGRSGPPEFTVTTIVRVTGEVSAPAEVRDGGATAAEVALRKLGGQVEVAVIGSYPLGMLIQQFASVDSQFSYNSEAETHLAGIQIDLALEWYQGPESFAPVDADDLNDIALDATRYPPAGFRADLQP